MVDGEAFVWALCHRKCNFGEAVCVAAICTGKMGVTLAFGAVIREFEMPCSFLQKDFMNNACFNKSFKNAINRYFVWSGRCKLCSNLVS